MKKIIALAVASAFVAPAFAAEITVSGDVEYTMTQKGGKTYGGVGDADFKITATEDMSNGYSVMAYIDFDSDYRTYDYILSLRYEGHRSKVKVTRWKLQFLSIKRLYRNLFRG